MIFFQALPTNKEKTKHMDAVYEELIEKVGKDDSQAFEELYHATDRAVYGFALSILKNRQDAEDIMQDTYLKIRASAHLYQKRGRPMAWILTITKNLALMQLRVQSRLSETPPEEARMGEEDKTDQSLDRLILKTALENLKQEERQIVTLHAAGIKNREIAQVLGIPLGTVLSKRARALKKLKQHIQSREGR